MADKRYQIGVVGAGARGETFARQLYKSRPDATLFGVCDIDEDRLGRFCDFCELKGTRQFTSVDAMIAEPGLDALIITTPEFTHAEVAVKAMQAGKHIYLEKPMANTIEGCHEIIDASRSTNSVAYLGFNLRASASRQKLKDVVQSGVLGQIVHIEGLEQLSQAHGASFMRRFHRRSANSGGLLNHKCSHDLDIMLWIIGHEHRVVRIASFGGTNVFKPSKKPADHCRDCPREIFDKCAYKSVGGFVFPVRDEPIYHRVSETYGGDLCVYNDDKDIIDNQSVIMEWDNGVRGTFNLQMFQNTGTRRTCVWGEKGYAELDDRFDGKVRVVDADSGDTSEYAFKPRAGGHGGTDLSMIGRFIEAIESGGATDSGIDAGLAATVVAIKADEARLSGKVVNVDPGIYTAGAVAGVAG